MWVRRADARAEGLVIRRSALSRLSLETGPGSAILGSEIVEVRGPDLRGWLRDRIDQRSRTMWLATALIGHKPDQRSSVFVLLLSSVGGLVIYLAERSVELAYAFGLLATFVVGIYSVRRLDGLLGLRQWLKKKFAFANR